MLNKVFKWIKDINNRCLFNLVISKYSSISNNMLCSNFNWFFNRSFMLFSRFRFCIKNYSSNFKCINNLDFRIFRICN